VQTFFCSDLWNPADRASRGNNGPRAKSEQRAKKQRFNRKLQVILAREKIAGELENKSASYRSCSFYFRDRSFDCDYAHV
jgi:hypothetical protein